MVRVLAIADEETPVLTPKRLEEIGADLVLSAGDLPWSYLEYVATATDVPLGFVPGNHDPARPPGRRSRSGLWLRDGQVAPEPRPLGGTDLDLAVSEIAGLRVAGLGGCVRYRPGPHQYDQREFRRRCRRLVRRARGRPVDVLLTHAPPAGMGDDEDSAHQGIEALRDLLDTLQPRWHLHGHVHPHGRVMPDRAHGSTQILNVIPYRVLTIADHEEDDGARHRIPAR